MAEQERLVDYWKTHKEVRFEEFGGKPGRIISARLLAGSDLLQGIVEVAKRYRLRAGAIQVAFGSLGKAVIRWEELNPEGKRGTRRSAPKTLEGPVTLLCGQGKVGVPLEGDPVIHMHGVVSDTKGQVWGSHFFPEENPVFSTLEVVIQEIQGVEFVLMHDPQTDSQLLRARRIDPEF